MNGFPFAFATVVLALAGWTGRLQAASISVPGGSFESPVTPYVSVNIDSWQKADQPDWYVETGGFLWSYNVGLFKNTAAGSSDHIDNCDGAQAIWLFVVPEVALLQDYDSIDWSNLAPTHAFDVRFLPGNSYQLTVGVIGTGGGMLEGATLELSLYFRDADSNKVTVAAISVTNTTAVFNNNTHLVDFKVNVPVVRAADPWAGQHLGIQLLSTVDPSLQGGYWDLDNVRLSSTLEPILVNPYWTNNQFQFTLQCEPGLAVEMLSTTNFALPLSAWDGLGWLTNVTGTTTFTDPAAAAFGSRYYTARRVVP